MAKPRSDCRRPRRTEGLCLEPLEPRRLLAVDVVVDYSYDANNFFDTAQKRALLEQAADTVARWFTDELLPINPSNGNTWEVTFDDPATGVRRTVHNPSVAANQVVLYAGGRNMTDALGRGGPGGYNASGTTAWLDRIANRGQGGKPEVAPWGGAITFDSDPDNPWHFGTTTDGLAGRNDFLSVASHEVAHLLGFGTSRSWRDFISAGRFVGPLALTQHDGDGTGVPLEGGPEPAHWAEGTTGAGQDVAMDPRLTTGTRRLLTALDFAALDDIGWTMPPKAAVTGGGAVEPNQANHEVVVTYSHYAAIEGAFIDQGDVTVTGPGGTPLTVVAARTISGGGGGGGTVRQVGYTVAAPGGTWDPSDTGTYTVHVGATQVRSSTGEFVPAGAVGTFSADVGDRPVARVQPVAQPGNGAPTHTVSVEYTDAVDVDVATLDPNDIEVSGPGGVPVAVTVVTPDVTAPGPRVVATYTLAAPGGTWGREDDGLYVVRVRDGQVADTSGNTNGLVQAGFEVSLGAVPFDARTPAVYTDPAGTVVRVMLKGPGSGRLRVGDAASDQNVRIQLSGSTGASTLVVKSRVETGVRDVEVEGALKALNAPAVRLEDSLSVGGPLGLLRLGSTGVDSSVSLASVGRVKLGSLNGQFRTTGSIGAINARSMDGAVIFAGVRPDHGPELPDSLDSFVNPAASIGSVVTRLFMNSVVAAPLVGRLSLGGIGQVERNAGVAADRISSLAARPDPLGPPLRLRNLDLPGSGVVLENFEVSVL